MITFIFDCFICDAACSCETHSTSFLRDCAETGKESRKGISYYLRKDEIPAEVKGFRRIVKLRKEPVEKVMKDWFERHKNIHKFSDRQIKKLIPQLVDYYNKFYPLDK